MQKAGPSVPAGVQEGSAGEQTADDDWDGWVEVWKAVEQHGGGDVGEAGGRLGKVWELGVGKGERGK